MMIEVTINQIHESGYFLPTRVKVPENLARIINGVNKMYHDGIFKFKPHLKMKRDIYTVAIKTSDVEDDVIQQLKDIATDMGCNVKIDNCYHWITIANKKEDIKDYFTG